MSSWVQPTSSCGLRLRQGLVPRIGQIKRREKMQFLLGRRRGEALRGHSFQMGSKWVEADLKRGRWKAIFVVPGGGSQQRRRRGRGSTDEVNETAGGEFLFFPTYFRDLLVSLIILIPIFLLPYINCSHRPPKYSLLPIEGHSRLTQKKNNSP
jgi:hypothetical protein